MTNYPKLARKITDLRRRGDIVGAIEAFKQSPEEDRRNLAVRSAIAWCLYDRDIKPCNDPEIKVTTVFSQNHLQLNSLHDSTVVQRELWLGLMFEGRRFHFLSGPVLPGRQFLQLIFRRHTQ